MRDFFRQFSKANALLTSTVIGEGVEPGSKPVYPRSRIILLVLGDGDKFPEGVESAQHLEFVGSFSA